MASHFNRAGKRRFEESQLFCLVVGLTLIAAGIVGFFYESTFTSDEAVRGEIFGLLDTNGWHNVVHLVTGAVTLAFAFQPAAAARAWSLVFGLVYLAVAAWGFLLGSGESILSIIPVNTADNILHLVLGLAGLAVYALTASWMHHRHPAAHAPA